LDLLEAMRQAGVWRFVFSSTTATYGQPDKIPIAESTLQQPINPYGFTKLVIEHALSDYAKAYGFGVAALRYFNAAGAAEDGTLGEDHDPESHIIPIVLQVALGQRDFISIYGDDYPTPDGTCVRDYIHVNDLGTAHLKALNLLQPGSNLQLNLGTGHGTSVMEVIQACRQVTGHPIPARMAPRREGDPACLIADSSLAQRTLDWKPQYPADYRDGVALASRASPRLSQLGYAVDHHRETLPVRTAQSRCFPAGLYSKIRTAGLLPPTLRRYRVA
jgi:UDP-glucose 4-epimerase